MSNEKTQKISKEVKNNIKASLSGLSYKEAKRILLDLLEELTESAIITSPK